MGATGRDAVANGLEHKSWTSTRVQSLPFGLKQRGEMKTNSTSPERALSFSTRRPKKRPACCPHDNLICVNIPIRVAGRDVTNG